MFNKSPVGDVDGTAGTSDRDDPSRVSAKALHALLKRVNKDEPRHWLRGILIDQCGNGTTLVVTDGNVLIAHQIDTHPRPPKAAILSYADAKALPKAGFIEFALRNDQVILYEDLASTSLATIEGVFPDWRARFAEAVLSQPQTPSYFDAAELHAVESTIEAITGSKHGAAWADSQDYGRRYCRSYAGDVVAIVCGRSSPPRMLDRLPDWATGVTR